MRPIQSQRDTFALRLAEAYDPDKPIDLKDSYAQFYTPTERNEKGHIRVHRGLVVPSHMSPEQIASAGGLGPHWSVNPQISEALADPDVYGENDDDIGMVFSGWLDPAHGRNTDSDALTGGSGYHNEQELTLHPGTPVQVDQVRVMQPGANTNEYHPVRWQPRQIEA